jgi:hypothetical protein
MPFLFATLFSLGICFQTKSNVFKRDRLSIMDGRFLLVRYALYLSSYNHSPRYLYESYGSFGERRPRSTAMKLHGIISVR